jgi:hypothetical protein
MEQQSIPIVVCPGCKIKMTVRVVLPARPNIRRVETIVYQCPRCDLETTRHVTPSNSFKDGTNRA